MKEYLKYRSNPEAEDPALQTAKASPQTTMETKAPTAIAKKRPAFGLQIPLKPDPGKTQNTQAPPPNNKPKQAFVYERPTLPDRKPKFPANWPGRTDKKPKR